MTYDNALTLYDQAVMQCSRFERKGKSMPHTSANGYMFSLLNKNGELGIRFSKETQEKYINDWNSSHFKSHGATMKGYVQVPEQLLNSTEKLIHFLNESYDYVMTLPPK